MEDAEDRFLKEWMLFNRRLLADRSRKCVGACSHPCCWKGPSEQVPVAEAKPRVQLFAKRNFVTSFDLNDHFFGDTLDWTQTHCFSDDSCKQLKLILKAAEQKKPKLSPVEYKTPPVTCKSHSKSQKCKENGFMRLAPKSEAGPEKAEAFENREKYVWVPGQSRRRNVQQRLKRGPTPWMQLAPTSEKLRKLALSARRESVQVPNKWPISPMVFVKKSRVARREVSFSPIEEKRISNHPSISSFVNNPHFANVHDALDVLAPAIEHNLVMRVVKPSTLSVVQLGCKQTLLESILQTRLDCDNLEEIDYALKKTLALPDYQLGNKISNFFILFQAPSIA
ncbi:hypothetical protein Ciccas_009863 [Cichlidogyrus casuarinus]|uniref:Uncharacterized protein n=1 Tax=Cichlidogyrus casuarinus TaxID=1844966 RepID=A0ABD2PXB2_9PLAT